MLKGKWHEQTVESMNIKVDYEKQKVSFAYPSDHTEYSNLKYIYGICAFMWFVGCLSVLALVAAGFIIADLPRAIANIGTVNIPPIRETLPAGKTTMTTFGGLLVFLPFVLYLFLPPFLMALVLQRTPKFYEIAPILQFKMQTFSLFGGTSQFKTTYRSLKRKKLVIPVFRNVLLRYKATKDFSQYLKSVNIKEQKFQTVKGKREAAWWKAEFEFSQVPKKGQLYIEFY